MTQTTSQGGGTMKEARQGSVERNKSTKALIGIALLALASLGLIPSPTQAQTVEYYHLDAVGNVLAVTDASGVVVEQHDYYPFGEECTTAPCASQAGTQPKRFTGKERDNETGLDYFGARYYSAKYARFTTVDPALNASALFEPQRWNRYANGGNNPFRYVDPDGRDILEKVREWYAGFNKWREERASAATARERQWLAASNYKIIDRETGEPVDPASLSDEQVHELYERAHQGGDPNAVIAPMLGVTRVTNPKHHQNSSSPQPKNVEELWNRSIKDDVGRRWAKDADGTIHRFSAPSNGESHWNGSTARTPGNTPIKPEAIPIKIRRQLE